VKTLTATDDLLVPALPTGAPQDGDPPWFDRFYYNLHPSGFVDDNTFMVFGAGSYPAREVVDGYVCVAVGTEQRNLRFSDKTGGSRPDGVGPLAWEILEPLRSWRLRLAENPTGVEFDLVWEARTPAWAVDPIRVNGEDGFGTDFEHFFQSGRYRGTWSLDGRAVDVDGWVGHRDRSRGLRRTRDRLGFHIWIAGQFDDACVALNFNVDRNGRTSHCDGAVLGEDGTTQEIVDALHDLTLDQQNELEHGTLRLHLSDGSSLDVDFAGMGRGIYMSGGGYGGWQGADRGPNYAEHEVWPLDGSVQLSGMPLALTDKACRFTRHNDVGGEAAGLVELAVSRSSSFTYERTLT
jgi:hypothetical protein